MKPVIALLDTGVNSKLFNEYNVVEIGNSQGDVNGHGTLCCSTILSINPNAQILSYQVLDKNNSCSSFHLIDNLKQLLSIDVDIINLSLSTSNILYMHEYDEICKLLKSQNKIIIASSANNGSYSLPGCLTNTIGVKGRMFYNESEYWFNDNEIYQCLADSKLQLTLNAQGNYELFGGNSKATAVFSGIVSQIVNSANDNSYDNILKEIQTSASKKKWSVITDDPNVEFLYSYDSLTMEKLKKIVCETLEISDIDLQSSIISHMNRFNAWDLMKNIDNAFKLNLTYSNINYYWFTSFKALYYYLFGGENEKGTIS